jgi:hypothetical protein
MNPKMTLDFGYFNGGEIYIPLSEIGFRIKKIQNEKELNNAKQLFVSSNRSNNNGGARAYYTKTEWLKFNKELFKAELPENFPKLKAQSKSEDECALVAVKNLCSSLNVDYNFEMEKKKLIKNNSTCIVNFSNLPDLLSNYFGFNKIFKSKSLLKESEKQCYEVKNWQEVDNLGSGLFIIFGFFDFMGSIGHYVSVNKLLGDGVIFDGSHERHGPQNALAFNFSVRAGEILLPHPKKVYRIYLNNN